MPESEYSQDNLAAIRTHLNNLEQMVRFNTATNPQNKTAIVDLFAAHAGLAEVYIAMEGDPKSQADLAGALAVSQPTVSRALKHLQDAGLVTAIPPGPGRIKTAYARSPVEPLIGVSRIARDHVSQKVQSPTATRTKSKAPARSRNDMVDSGDVPKRLDAEEDRNSR